MEKRKKFRNSIFLLLVLSVFSCVHINDRECQVYADKGMQMVEQGNYSEGERLLSKSIACKPNDAALYNDRGVLRFYQHEYEKAAGDYTRALSLKTDY